MRYFTTLWRVLAKAFRTIANRLPDNKDDCPPVMPSRHSKDAHDMLEQHLKETGCHIIPNRCTVCGRETLDGKEFPGCTASEVTGIVSECDGCEFCTQV